MAEHKNVAVMKKIEKAAPGVGINEKVMKKIEKASKGS